MTNSLIAPPWFSRSTDIRLQAVARAARPDYPAWLSHVKASAACTRPVRLAGTMATVEVATGRILSERHTADLPDGVIYKPCGNRRDAVCPACSQVYKRDAYQVLRTGLVGGKGVPERVALHPAVFPTFTAPSFGEVHTRHVKHHTCTKRTACDCRPEPCHDRRNITLCKHGARLVCFARHADTDRNLGSPLCRDCYDYDAQAVWNLTSKVLWRRTTIAVNRHLRRLARARGIPFLPVRPPTARCGGLPRSGCRSATPPRCNAAASCTSAPSSASTATTPTTPTPSCRPRPGWTLKISRTPSTTPPPRSPSPPARTPPIPAAGRSGGASRSSPRSSPSRPKGR
jgi:hypothetical protein